MPKKKKASANTNTSVNSGNAQRPRVLVLEALSNSGWCVRRAGGEPTTVSPRYGSQKCWRAIERTNWDALLLTGGSDINPREYGEKVHKSVYGINQVRDAVEIHALQIARERNLPVLGICRGCQMINVEAGGSLRQDINGHRGGMHWVKAYPGSILDRAAGSTMKVVSLHHQEVRRPGKGIVPIARALDRTVEAIQTVDGRCLGVQFHPEMDDDEAYAMGIFRWLVCEAARRAGLPEPQPRLALSSNADFHKRISTTNKSMQKTSKKAKAPVNYGLMGKGKSVGEIAAEVNAELQAKGSAVGKGTSINTYVCQTCGGEYAAGELSQHIDTPAHLEAENKRRAANGKAPRTPLGTCRCSVCDGEYQTGSLLAHRKTTEHGDAEAARYGRKAALALGFRLSPDELGLAAGQLIPKRPRRGKKPVAKASTELVVLSDFKAATDGLDSRLDNIVRDAADAYRARKAAEEGGVPV